MGTGDDQKLLSDGVDGTFGQYVAAPTQNLVPKPTDLTWTEAACLPTAWLTAWRMLFRSARALPGERILVQGATGGLASGAIQLGVAAGLHVTATSRSTVGQEWATELGAHEAIPSGARVPHRVDVVIDSVGEATAEHSQRSMNPGGRWVVAGGTSGMQATIDIGRLFWRELQIIGVTMGSISDLTHLIAFLQRSGLRPRIGKTHTGVEHVPDALASLLDGSARGKLVIEL